MSVEANRTVMESIKLACSNMTLTSFGKWAVTVGNVRITMNCVLGSIAVQKSTSSTFNPPNLTFYVDPIMDLVVNQDLMDRFVRGLVDHFGIVYAALDLMTVNKVSVNNHCPKPTSAWAAEITVRADDFDVEVVVSTATDRDYHVLEFDGTKVVARDKHEAVKMMADYVKENRQRWLSLRPFDHPQ